MLGGPERAEFFAKAQPWLAERDRRRDRRIEPGDADSGRPGQRRRDGRWTARNTADAQFFVPARLVTTGRSAGRAPPFRLSRTPVLPPRPAPRLGAEQPPKRLRDQLTGTIAGAGADPSLPFAGIKVLDLSTFWAGAYLTCYLGAFGAEIIKVESIQRPDGHRYSGAWAYEGDRWYERSAVWQGTNLNKRDVTLDLTSDRGRDLVRRLIRDADVVVENFSPRVIEQFGLDSDSLVELKPDVILVRMPGFGLQGPWRDYVGWALNFEQTSGMAAATGYADGPPCTLQGPADPIVGVHAGVALLAALEHRRRTGECQLIEVAQIEVAACVAAEPVIEYSMNASAQPREGNRCRGHVQVSTQPLSTTHGWRYACAMTPLGAHGRGNGAI